MRVRCARCDVLVFADSREALVTARVEAEPGPFRPGRERGGRQRPCGDESRSEPKPDHRGRTRILSLSVPLLAQRTMTGQRPGCVLVSTRQRQVILLPLFGPSPLAVDTTVS